MGTRPTAEGRRISLRTAGGGDEGADLLHQLAEAVEGELLGAVAPGFGGVGVDFDEEGIGAHGDGAFGHGGDQGGFAGTLAGIDDHGDVGFGFEDGNGGEVEGIAGPGFVSADTAFAEQEAGVVIGEDVFAGEEPFFDLHGHATFHQDGFAGAGGGDEQLEVLGVAGADLEDIGVFGDYFRVVFGEQFSDHGQAGFATGAGEEFEAFFAEALEFVGGGAGFEGAAAEDGGAGFLDCLGGAQELVGAFDRARAGHDMELGAADHHLADGDGGIGGVGFAADQFMAFLDGGDRFDLGPDGEGFEGLMGMLVADGANDDAGDAAHDVGTVAELADFAEHGEFVFAGGIGFKDDNHGVGAGSSGGRNKTAAGGKPAAGVDR